MNYTKLNVWKYARELVKLPQNELYSLRNRVHRSLNLVPLNISEGFGSPSNKESIPFLFLAKGSLNEVKTQLYVSFDLEYFFRNKIKKHFRKTDFL